ncbi:hypothetical protein G6F65_013951 [Rhizopus arrhizus]|nr:hypothetical protein G6F65_013951 [Rhizopus arrhizus]
MDAPGGCRPAAGTTGPVAEVVDIAVGSIRVVVGQVLAADGHAPARGDAVLHFRIQLPFGLVGLARDVAITEVEHAGGAAVAVHAGAQRPVIIAPCGRETAARTRGGVGEGVGRFNAEQHVVRVQCTQLCRRGQHVLQRGLGVRIGAGQQQLAIAQRRAPGAHQLGAAGAGVGGVDEEAGALQAADAEVGRHVVGQRIAGDAFRQCDAVINVDLEEVQRQVEVLADAAGEAQRGVDRLFRLQVLRTQAARDRMVDRQQAPPHQRAAGVVAGGDRAAQREGRSEFVAQAELAGQFAAEVVVVLVARSQVGGELLAELAGQAGIGAGHVARQVCRILRGQAATGLRTGRAVGVRAGGVAGRVTRTGLVALVACFHAKAQRVADAVALGEYTAQVEVAHRLRVLVIGGLEAGRAGRAQRGVERITQAVGEVVLAVIQAAVIAPLAPLAAHAGHGLHVAVLALGDRPVAVRIDLLPVGIAIGVAEVVRAFGIALVEGAERVEGRGLAHRNLGVQPQVDVLALAIAQHVVALALQRQVVRGLVPRRNLVEAGAVGAVAVLVLQADAQEATVLAQRGADLGADVAGLAIGEGAPDRLEVGVVGAVTGFDLATVATVVEDHSKSTGVVPLPILL